MSVPFTPVDGKRIIGPNQKSNSEALVDLISYTNEQNYSSLHALYVENHKGNF